MKLEPARSGKRISVGTCILCYLTFKIHASMCYLTCVIYSYHNLPKVRPCITMGGELKRLLKEGGGLNFECFDIPLKSRPTTGM